jgi:hypothetical protein
MTKVIEFTFVGVNRSTFTNIGAKMTELANSCVMVIYRKLDPVSLINQQLVLARVLIGQPVRGVRGRRQKHWPSSGM